MVKKEKNINRNPNAWRLKFYIFLVFPAFLTCGLYIHYCSPTMEAANATENRLNEKALEIISTQSGIIGSLNLNANMPGPINKFQGAVHGVYVYDLDSFDVKYSGVGTRIRDTKQQRDFVLTAAHVLFDKKTLKPNGQIFAFGSVGTILEYDIYSLSEETYRKYSNTKETKIRLLNDIIAIEVPYDALRDAIPIDSLDSNFDLISKDQYSFGSLSSFSLPKTQNAAKLYQPIHVIEYPFDKNVGFVTTDADGFKGISGSPAFYYKHDKALIFGVITSGHKQKNCEAYSKPLCTTVITLPNHINTKEILAKPPIPIKKLQRSN